MSRRLKTTHHSMPRLRLGYTKSRGGCLRCKQRRVKCDESRPCKACLRHGIECSLAVGSAIQEPPSPSAVTETASKTEGPPPASDAASRVPNSSTPIATAEQLSVAYTRLVPPHDRLTVRTESATASSNASTFSTTASPVPTSPDPFPYFSKFTTESPGDETENWASDLELLHHYTTCTYRTLATGYNKDLMQIEMPKLGFANLFLLHELLAISAFHLAYLDPSQSKKYTLQATHHQSRAIEGIRIALVDITPSNCHALFAASTFLFVGSLAASRPRPGDDNKATNDFSVDKLVDVFLLLKGVRGIIDSTDQLVHGPLGEFFQPLEVTDSSPALACLTTQLSKLAARVPEIAPTAGERNVATISREIERLIECIREAGRWTSCPEYQILASWPLSVSDMYIGLLRRRNQAALAVMAYYCIVMHLTEEDYWFTRGWSMSVIRDIAKVMAPPWNQDSAWALAWISGQVSVQ